jgi:hypothetical protein
MTVETVTVPVGRSSLPPVLETHRLLSERVGLTWIIDQTDSTENRVKKDR